MPFTTTRRVAFAETDMAGIVHFANFYRYMEEAEHAVLRTVGLRVIEKQADGTTLSWPRVAASCEFEAPAFYEDVLTISVSVERLGTKSLTLAYEFFRDEALIATGRMTAVCCLFRDGEEMEPIAIPAEIRARIEKIER
ncbi:MAG: acyl-CoA thioesterase [Planctomycetaceae bacterium]